MLFCPGFLCFAQGGVQNDLGFVCYEWRFSWSLCFWNLMYCFYCGCEGFFEGCGWIWAVGVKKFMMVFRLFCKGWYLWDFFVLMVIGRRHAIALSGD